MKYRYIVNDEVFTNLDDLVGKILINTKEESLEVIKVTLCKESEIKVNFKNKEKPYVLEEKYYLNYKRELVDESSVETYKTALETEHETLQSIVEDRNIEFLCHFTNIKNLDYILSDGLVTKEKLIRYADSETNDNERFDLTDAICVSVSFPNYKMLYKLRNSKRDSKWVILILDKALLWELNCSFFYTNASSSLFKSRHLEEYKTLSAFNKMFCEKYPPDIPFRNNKIVRSDLKIPERYTTDPQSEVLVFNDIPNKYILKIAYSSIEDKSRYEEKFNQHTHMLKQNLFNGRLDYKHWQKGENDG